MCAGGRHDFGHLELGITVLAGEVETSCEAEEWGATMRSKWTPRTRVLDPFHDQLSGLVLLFHVSCRECFIVLVGRSSLPQGMRSR